MATCRGVSFGIGMGDSEATAALQDEALAAVAAGVLVVSAAGVVLLANAGAAALCGRPVAALRGMLATELLPELLLRAREPTEPVAVVEVRRPDHSAMWCAYEARPSASGWTLALFDISAERELQRSLEALRRSERDLESVLENIPSMVYLKDAESLRFVRVNRAGEEMLGLRREEMLGRNDHDFFRGSRRAEALAEMDRAALAHKGVTVDEFSLPTPHRGRRVFVVKKVPLVDEDGVVRRLLGIAEDITARKQVEASLAAARDVADAASRAKSEFLANMSHEIRTPLHGVLGMAALLLDTPLSPAQREQLQTIHGSGLALVDIINDILDFSKIDAGKLSLEAIDFDPRVLVREATAVVALRAQEKGLVFTTQIAAAVPAAVRGDPVRLRQVLVNLLGNAVKFTASGSVTLSVGLTGADEEAVGLRCEVRDTGVGIAAEAQTRVFESFTQSDSSTTRRFGGTGLGLAICRRLVTLMGGEIGLESAPGRGSEFWFTAKLARATAPLPAAEATGASGSPGSRSQLRRARVLVAEDNLVNQRVATAMLAKLGQDVEVAQHGREAVERWRARPFDLVLMDCQMPEMDGFTATRAIRSEEVGGRRVPIVAMTAFAMKGDRERCFAAGMDDYIAKPMPLAALADVLARWVGVGPDAPSPRPADERSPVALALWEELRAELAEDELRELLAVLRRQAATIFGEMRGRLAAGDLHAIGALAHKLCGSAGNLGAQGLAQELQQIEAACRSPGEGRALGEADVAALERSFAAADAFFRAQLPES